MMEELSAYKYIILELIIKCDEPASEIFSFWNLKEINLIQLSTAASHKEANSFWFPAVIRRFGNILIAITIWIAFILHQNLMKYDKKLSY